MHFLQYYKQKADYTPRECPDLFFFLSVATKQDKQIQNKRTLEPNVYYLISLIVDKYCSLIFCIINSVYL